MLEALIEGGRVSVYSIVVFLHVVGALGLFAGVGVEQLSFINLRRADTNAQARDWLSVLVGMRRVDAPSGLTILATGFYMVAVRWGNQAWIGLALLGMILMAALSIGLTSRRAKATRSAVPGSDGPISSVLRGRLTDPALRTPAILRAATGLGIVFNMSVKPAAPGALAAMGVALALGAAVAFVSANGAERGSARIVALQRGDKT